jgi:hypothetical protein
LGGGAVLFENFVKASVTMLWISAADLSLSFTMRDFLPEASVVVLGRGMMGAAAVLRGALVGPTILRALVEAAVTGLRVVDAFKVLVEPHGGGERCEMARSLIEAEGLDVARPTVDW